MPTEADRLFRDFVRYTGDGLPGEPAGWPLPTGDPSSGRHNPKAADFRAWANALETGGGGGGGGTAAYASVADFQAAAITADVTAVMVISAGGEMIGYIRQAGANGPQDLTHPNGSTWAKATLTQEDLLAAVTDLSASIDRIPFQSGAYGGMTIVPQTPGTFACTYTVQRISWQRVGHTVSFEARIAGTPTLGSAAGQLRIQGFPFASVAVGGAGWAQLRASQGINLRHGTAVPAFVSGYFPDGVSYMLLTVGDATGAAAQTYLPIDRLTTGTPFRLEFGGSYEITI